MNGYDLENQSCGRARSSCRRSTTGFTGTATTAASVLDTCCNGANSRNHQRFRRKRVELQANRVARSMQLRWSRPRGRDGRLGDSRRFESITCIILNRQLSRKLLDSSLSAAESQEFVGRQRIFFAPAIGWRGILCHGLCGRPCRPGDCRRRDGLVSLLLASEFGRS